MLEKRILVFALCVWIGLGVSSDEFVKVKGTRFWVGTQPYYYIGTNYWYGVNLGAPVSGDQERMIKELDQLQSLGVNNLRIMAGGQGPDDREKRIVPSIEPTPLTYNEDVWLGFDFLLHQMRKRGMKAVVPINNFWEWSGGFGQYVEWHGGEFEDAYSFYSMPEVQQHFHQFIDDMLSRTNTINGLKYNNDSTVMAWQLSNEPRTKDCKQYSEWIQNTTAFIKARSPNILISLGNEGTITPCAKEANEVKALDYVTFHCWAQNWGWYDPLDPGSIVNALKKVKTYLDENIEIGSNVGKPVVLEEFGIARDLASFDPTSPTEMRDRYYSFVFEYVLTHVQSGESNIVGANFWAYGGMGRPREDGGWWQTGDDFIGDPPHERQGWYSVYDTDTTLAIVKNYTNNLNAAVQELKTVKYMLIE